MNPFLLVIAIVPAAILLWWIYKNDKLERESPRLLGKLILFGAISTLIAIVGEIAGEFILDNIFYYESTLYNLLMYFVVVGISEELGKFLVLKWKTWKDPEFNCAFDGVVYAVFVSLGFAVWENIKYVAYYGLATALVRAVTAVPGHACFGVFMGVYYAQAKLAENNGDYAKSKAYRFKAVLVPVLIHGAYDFLATWDANVSGLAFIVYIILLFILAFINVKRCAKNDTYI